MQEPGGHGAEQGPPRGDPSKYFGNSHLGRSERWVGVRFLPREEHALVLREDYETEAGPLRVHSTSTDTQHSL